MNIEQYQNPPALLEQKIRIISIRKQSLLSFEPLDGFLCFFCTSFQNLEILKRTTNLYDYRSSTNFKISCGTYRHLTVPFSEDSR